MTRLESLKAATSLADVAILLGFNPRKLAWVIYQQPAAQRYTIFTIPKSRGGLRTIKAPEPRLKMVQARLSALLQDCIADINAERQQKEKLSHGFRRQHSILTNAYEHRSKKFVLNVDLANFFDTIHFGRVRGFFMANKHFALHERAATVLAHIACHESTLPQGAPTSPVISNLIAHILDVRLAKLARRYGLRYTRYADDLTFSTNQKSFPGEIAAPDATGKWVASPRLIDVIERALFNLNPAKTRLQFARSRQDVTGIIVNEKVNVRPEYYRDVRAKCHRLFKTGKFTTKGFVKQDDGTFEMADVDGTPDQLEGMLSFIDSVKGFRRVAGKDRKLTGSEELYRRFLFYRNCYAAPVPMIFCEGKTDNIYVRCAMEALHADYPKLAEKVEDKLQYKVRMFNYSERSKRLMGLSGGSSHLKDFVSNYRKNLKPFQAEGERFPVILLIDNDDGAPPIFGCVKNLTKKDCDGTASFYYIGDNLYVVPTPLATGGGKTMIEDFLPTKWRAELLNGKKLNLGKNLDTDTEYGKALFAEHVIKKNRAQVDFDGMRAILDRIVEVMDDYAAMTA